LKNDPGKTDRDGLDYNKDNFKKPSVTVDVAVCTVMDSALKVLLIKRALPPFLDQWAIPGGFVDVEKKETLAETALKMLSRETNVSGIYLEQLKTYGAPERDPRLRVITVAYFALAAPDKITDQMLIPNDDARELAWFDLRKLPAKLAFDHKQILGELRQRLAGKISYTPIAFSLVPRNFTWSDLEKVYEIVLDEPLITPNFRRKIKAMYHIKELKGKRLAKEKGRPPVYLRYEGIRNQYRP